MKKRLPLLLAMGVLLTSLVCLASQPGQEPSGETETQTESLPAKVTEENSGPVLPGPAQDPARANQAVLDELLQQLVNLGTYYEIDADQNGQPEQWIYAEALEKLPGDVDARQYMAFMDAGSERYEYYLMFNLVNMSAAPQQVSYTWEIPKEFAETVELLVFSIPPSQVLEDDPIVVFDIALGMAPAGANPQNASQDIDYGDAAQWVTAHSAMAEVITTAVQIEARLKIKAFRKALEACQKAPADKQEMCYLNLVQDFGDILPQEDRIDLCFRTQGVLRTACVALASESPSLCDALTDPVEKDTCKALYISSTCARLPWYEQADCQERLAKETKSLLGCLTMKEEHRQNICLAQVSSDPKYCYLIPEPARQETCLEKLRQMGVLAQPAQPGQPPPQDAPAIEKFEPVSANALCEQIGLGLPGLGLVGHSTEDGNLSCIFANSNNPSAENYKQIKVWISRFESGSDARRWWDDHDGPQSPESVDMADRQKRGEPVAISFEGAMYFISRSFTSGGVPFYDLSAGMLYGSTILRYKEDRSPDAEYVFWRQILRTLQSIVDDRAP